MVISALVFLLILSVLVLIHEAGHYFTAKKFGIKVEEFGFGFPLTPAIWQKKVGETVYSFYPLLIGGFVKLYGEDEAGAGRVEAAKEEKKPSKKDLERAFFSKPLWQRSVVIVAGVVMNTLLAIVIFYVYMFLANFQAQVPKLPQVTDKTYTFIGVNQFDENQVLITDVAKGSPADSLGITPGSIVTSVNGAPVTSLKQFSDTVKNNAGTETSFTWTSIESQEEKEGTATPRVNPPADEGSLGVALYENAAITLKYETPTQQALSGIVHPINLMGYQFFMLGNLINQSVEEKDATPVTNNVSGPLGILYIVNIIVDFPDLKEAVLQLLNLAGLLSLSLAFFNILPIPGLDGGRFAFILFESITGRKIDPKVEGYIHGAGMVLLLGLLLLVTIKDIKMFF